MGGEEGGERGRGRERRGRRGMREEEERCRERNLFFNVKRIDAKKVGCVKRQSSLSVGKIDHV